MTGKSDGTQAPRRFYKAVTVEPVAGGHAVRLDGRGPKGPGGTPLVLPTPALAALVAAEWDAQTTIIDMTTMPALRLAWTALEALPPTREAVAGEVARYAGSDLLCYRADAPASLAAEQAAGWSPWLDWVARDLAVSLVPTSGLIHQPQPDAAIETVRALALGLDDFSLTGLAHGVGLLGSAVLALALQRGQIDGQTAHDLARLDEAFQERLWGQDAEAAVRTEGRRQEALLLDRWFAALR
ncbi:MAG: ATP12 family protein [Caulobacter sp.]|nr:ATP12 family protein [Caulobacter sp.]